MDILKKLGELALGSRLKHLSDLIMKDGAEIYKKNSIDFEPRWFPVYYTLTQHDNIGIMEIAQEIGVKHPTVSQVVKELEKKGYVNATTCSKDGRKKLVVLTEKGNNLLPEIELIWKDISNVLHELNQKHKQNILCAIDDFEDDFNKLSMLDRVQQMTSKRLIDEVNIIEFKDEYTDDFKTLNEEWINKYFTIENEDIEILSNPLGKIIYQGGAIIFAEVKGEIVGVCALLYINNYTYELAKMAVTEQYQGRQIGKKLGLAILEKAKYKGAKKVILETNKQLTTAINLYENLGFKLNRASSDTSVYERCDVTMELDIH